MKNALCVSKYIFLYLVVSLGLFFIAREAFSVGYWSHDDFPYRESYSESALKTTGRWFHYLAYPLLRELPQKASWLFCVISYFTFFYFTFRRILKSHLQSFLLAGVALSSVTFYCQLLWPVGLITNAIILLFTIPLSKRLPMPVFFYLFGILFFFCLPHSIYLLPLLYLDQFKDKNTKESFIFLGKLLFFWFTSLIAGFFIASFLVYLEFGHWIYMAAWRKPHPATDLHSLVTNMRINLSSINHHIGTLVSDYQLIIVLFFCFSLLAFFYSRNKLSNWIQMSIFIIIGFNIAIIHYLLVLQSGIGIALRSIHSLYLGILVICLSLINVIPRTVVIAFLVLTLGFPAYIKSYQVMRDYHLVTKKFDALINIPESLPKNTLIQVDISNSQQLFKKFCKKTLSYKNYFIISNLDLNLRSALARRSFREFVFCSTEAKACEDIDAYRINVRSLLSTQ